MKNADVTVNVKRSGNVFNVQYDMKGASNSYQFKTAVTVNEEVPDALNIHITGEKLNKC